MKEWKGWLIYYDHMFMHVFSGRWCSVFKHFFWGLSLFIVILFVWFIGMCRPNGGSLLWSLQTNFINTDSAPFWQTLYPLSALCYTSIGAFFWHSSFLLLHHYRLSKYSLHTYSMHFHPPYFTHQILFYLHIRRDSNLTSLCSNISLYPHDMIILLTFCL